MKRSVRPETEQIPFREHTGINVTITSVPSKDLLGLLIEDWTSKYHYSGYVHWPTWTPDMVDCAGCDESSSSTAIIDLTHRINSVDDLRVLHIESL